MKNNTISERIIKQLNDVACEGALFHKLRIHLEKSKDFTKKETEEILNAIIIQEEI